MSMSNAPVVVFAYNRADKIERCLEALSRNIDADITSVYVFSDGAKSETDQKNVDAVREVIRSYQDRKCFGSFEVEEAPSNRGLANSVRHGVSKIIDEFEKVIVVEDDLICAKDFIKYMNQGLNFYKENSTVWSVAGYSSSFPELESYPHDVYMLDRAESWGWATWKDRWDSIDWNLSDYNRYKWNVFKIHEFRKCGYWLPLMLESQVAGRIDSWAIVFCYEQYKQKKLTVYPKISRVSNEGIDGSGTHKVSDDRWDTELNVSTSDVTFIDPYMDPKVKKGSYLLDSGPLVDRLKQRMISFVIHHILGR